MAGGSPTGGVSGETPPVIVLVSRDCPACMRAHEVVAEVRRLSPSVRLDVIDIDAFGIPDGVAFVGTPTYLIGDRIVSLGNPDPQDLVTLIEGWPIRDS